MTFFKQIDALADWPDVAPQGWHVFNAPRPIYGHQSWRGDFRHGVFYAAVDPANALAAEYIRENRALDAVLLRFVTEADVREWADGFLSENGYAEAAADFTLEECWRTYCESGGWSREVEI